MTPCAFCGEREATAADDGRPDCQHCASLESDPVETLGFGIDDEAFSGMTVQ